MASQLPKAEIFLATLQRLKAFGHMIKDQYVNCKSLSNFACSGPWYSNRCKRSPKEGMKWTKVLVSPRI